MMRLLAVSTKTFGVNLWFDFFSFLMGGAPETGKNKSTRIYSPPIFTLFFCRQNFFFKT